MEVFIQISDFIQHPAVQKHGRLQWNLSTSRQHGIWIEMRRLLFGKKNITRDVADLTDSTEDSGIMVVKKCFCNNGKSPL